MTKISLKQIGRRQFLKTSLSGLAVATLPRISFARSNPEVIVIGAGSSGLSATAELINKGKSVVCIEAMNRIGGRCYTNNSIFGVPYDLGAHWLHGFSNNQIAKYGKKSKDKFNVYKDPDRSLIYDGKKRSDGYELWRLYSKIKKIRNNISLDAPLLDFIPDKLQNNEWFDTVQKIISTRDFDNLSPYDDNENWDDSGYGDGFVKEGYGALLAHYRKDVPVKLETIAKEIKWDAKGVKVETNQGTISAKACIVTVSTGVLNSGKIKFTPALPKKKYEAFDGISMSNYYRITLQLKESFYKKFRIEPDMYLYTKVNSKKSKSPRSANGVLRVHKSNISFFNVKGQFGKDLEAEGSKASVDFILSDLRATFGSKFDKYLMKYHVTGWGKNPFTIGAYSGAKPGKARLRRVLGESVGGRIFFAGEATAFAWATVHGADRSGKRVVTELLHNVL